MPPSCMNEAARPQELRRARERRGRVGQVHQHEPAHDGIELTVDASQRLDVALHEAHGGRAGAIDAGRSQRDRGRVALDADDASTGPDEAGGQHGHVAGARAQVQDPHAGPEACGKEHPLGQGGNSSAWLMRRRCSAVRSPKT